VHGLIGLRLADKLSPEADFEAVLNTLFGALARGFAAAATSATE